MNGRTAALLKRANEIGEKAKDAAREDIAHADNSLNQVKLLACALGHASMRAAITEHELKELRTASIAICEMLDAGELQRNIDDDANPDFALRMITFVQKLQRFVSAAKG